MRWDESDTLTHILDDIANGEFSHMNTYQIRRKYGSVHSTRYPHTLPDWQTDDQFLLGTYMALSAYEAIKKASEDKRIPALFLSAKKISEE